MRRLLPIAILLTTGLAFASGGSLIPELGGKPAPSATLDDVDTAQAEVDRLVKQGQSGARRLAELAKTGELAARGRAIVGLGQVEGELAEVTLRKIREDGSEKQLVRTWAYAASLQRADTLDEALALAKLQGQYTGSDRAVQLAMARHLADADAEQLLSMLVSVPSLNGAVAPMLMEASIPELGRVMLTHTEDPVRRQAASWLAAQAAQKGRGDAVAKITISQLHHNPSVNRVPWKGGALYIPGIQWDKNNAKDLVRTLIQWKLYCERTGKDGEKNQVWNNLRSVQLLQAAGFKNRWPNDAQVLEEWANIGGKSDVAKLRGEQGWD
jgi:hypothetical protein